MSESLFYDGSYGDVRLLLSSIATEEGRDIAVQSPARGSRHFLQDRGRRMTSATVSILFVNQAGLGSALARFEQFRNLANSDEASFFVHPLTGPYLARVTNFSHAASSDSREITATCTFLAEDEPDPVTPVGAGVAPVAGIESVAAAVNDATEAIAAAKLPPSVADIANECLAIVQGWADEVELDSQLVVLEVATISGQIADAVDAYEIATDLTKWPAYRAMINLNYEMQRAGEAFTSSSDTMITVTVATARPLLAIASELYGPRFAVDMAGKLARMNRIRTPGRVPAGTSLRAPLEPT